MALLGWVGLVARTAIPQWHVSSQEGDNSITGQARFFWLFGVAEVSPELEGSASWDSDRDCLESDQFGKYYPFVWVLCTGDKSMSTGKHFQGLGRTERSISTEVLNVRGSLLPLTQGAAASDSPPPARVCAAGAAEMEASAPSPSARGTYLQSPRSKEHRPSPVGSSSRSPDVCAA
ncbi:uncharacterized protein LOC122210742 isoform X3 [Panthera leo]|uniref:uncharacterized protein LOC122210742 isoform X3 n=1 Tax=Panthera leo TaxID=9689 RepID=UPI001C6A5048|nr:uncharacterized protein LOC122210742 isoform X3 [Panthera leo]